MSLLQAGVQVGRYGLDYILGGGFGKSPSRGFQKLFYMYSEGVKATFQVSDGRFIVYGSEAQKIVDEHIGSVKRTGEWQWDYYRETRQGQSKGIVKIGNQYFDANRIPESRATGKHFVIAGKKYAQYTTARTRDHDIESRDNGKNGVIDNGHGGLIYTRTAPVESPQVVKTTDGINFGKIITTVLIGYIIKESL